ncbi:hypothetical protein HF313_09180 [Massilia atriviolacea]|uniref:hypothetical protein n=1 Tax=Massilia atriviolacea TaxID=2495579 RepID=UPI0038575774
MFTALSTDFLLREQFVTDPAQIMAEYLYGQYLPDDTADLVNQLVFAVMSNARLYDWMSNYARRLDGALPTSHAFVIDFARAVAASGDELTVLALIRGGAAGGGQGPGPIDFLLPMVIVIGGRAAAGTEMSPGGGTEMSPGALRPGTEMSPGGGTEMSPGSLVFGAPGYSASLRAGTEMSPGGGTEMSPGRLRAGTEMSPGGGTEMSPGRIRAGTEMSPGGGTEMSPGRIRAGTDMSPGFGTEMSGTHMSPGLVSSGTEMSPGYGTEQSGTHMSPGRFGGIGQLPGHLRISIDALARYANQLRVQGALQSSGFEHR